MNAVELGSFPAKGDSVAGGVMEDVPAPRLAIGYYGMSADAKLVDLIKHVRADEQQHSEVNHRYADGGTQATQLAVKDNAFRERAANAHPS